MLQGGSMGPRYVLQLLIGEKSQNWQRLDCHYKAREKISPDLVSLEF
jgi:hypothetical protein